TARLKTIRSTPTASRMSTRPMTMMEPRRLNRERIRARSVASAATPEPYRLTTCRVLPFIPPFTRFALELQTHE
ncbi:MAG: hypothetical protein KDA62_14695, partial [Planctomycetales bacterium]|nr:hypothetical protein [Planctomycetales bacterium]